MIDNIKASDTVHLQGMISEALLEIDENVTPSDSDILRFLSVILGKASNILFKVYRDESGHPRGFIAASIGKGFLVSELHASVMLAYVEPGWRGQNHTEELYLAFESWAKSRGAHKIVVMSMRKQTELSMQFIDKMDAEIVGTLLTKDL